MEYKELLKEIEYLHSLGLNAVPCNVNTKRPALFKWTSLKNRFATIDEIKSSWNYYKPDGIGIIAGNISGNLEILDIDCYKSKQPEQFKNDVFSLLYEYCPKIFDSGIIEKTQSSGYHIYYKVLDLELLSLDLVTSEGKTIIETQSEGSFTVCAPSPGYEFIDYSLSFKDIPTISAQERNNLITACKFFE